MTREEYVEKATIAFMSSMITRDTLSTCKEYTSAVVEIANKLADELYKE